MKRFLLLLFSLMVLSPGLFAYYQVNETCRNARMLLMDMKIGEAKLLLANEISSHPDNYYAYYLNQTCDAYSLMLNSSEEDYERFIDSFEEKREIMDDKSVESPFYLSCKSEMEIQAGMFNIIHGARFSGVNKIYMAYKEVYENLDKFPDFKPSLMLDGFFNVAMSNLPPFIKWVTSFFGVSSDYNYGFKLLNSVYESQKNIKGTNAETALFIIFAAKINKTPEMAYGFMQKLDSNISHLFIFRYFKANIAYRIGKNEEALSTLQQIDINNHPDGKIIYDYFMGKILLRKLDSSAAYYIHQYLDNLKKQEYFKEMTYSLAIYNLINGNKEEYDSLCEVVKNKGADINERDREALYDANLDYPPDVYLVKARLLLDGGYLKRFQTVLNKYENNPRNHLPYQLEYHLLKGRFESISGDTSSAINDFGFVINKGNDADYYFASDASLKLGNLYESQNKLETAKKYYKLATDLYKSNYYEYIGDKAEKATKRIKAKTK